jgi:hypothetical protein
MSFDGENWTYQCNSGLNHNIEEPVSEDIEQFWYLLDELDEKGKKFKAYEGKTFFALVDQYINSTEFISLAEKTKYDYSRYLEYIESNWGYDPVFMLNTVEAQNMGRFCRMVWMVCHASFSSHVFYLSSISHILFIHGYWRENRKFQT